METKIKQIPLQLPEGHPLIPAKYIVADVAAIQALQRGEATPEQQQHALNWIIYKLCLTYDLEYRPYSDRDSAIAGGKRFIGLQLVDLLNVSIRDMKETDKDGRTSASRTATR